MKLCTFTQYGRGGPGVVHDGKVFAVADILRHHGSEEAATSLLEVIASWSTVKGELSAPAALEAIEPVGLVDEVELLPPLPSPPKILGVALNNQALGGSADAISPNPMFFVEPASALTGAGHDIEIDRSFGLTHPEPELGVIIGLGGKHIPTDVALNHVFGYTIVDDVTSVDLKSEDSVTYTAKGAAALKTPDGSPAPGFVDGALHLTYHARSKGADTFLPMGPWIVTADEVANPDDLRVQMTMDGVTCFDDSTRNLRFSVAEVISFASRYFTLSPGDVIHTGSAATGAVRLRDIDYSRSNGSQRVITIEHVGSLVNRISVVDRIAAATS